MKKTITTALCLFWISCLFAQQPTYQVYYGVKNSFYNYEVNHVVTYPNGDALSVGQSIFDFTTNNYDIDLVKFDKYGNVIFQKKISSYYSSQSTDCIATSDNGILIYTYQFRPQIGKDKWGSAVIKCDSNGVVQWAKYYDMPAEFRHMNPEGVIEMRNGDFLLQFSIYNSVYIQNYMGLIRISSTGEIKWNTAFELYLGSYNMYMAETMLETKNGDIYIGGYLECPDCITAYRGIIVQLREDGKMVQARSLNSDYEYGFAVYHLYEIGQEIVAYGTYIVHFNSNRVGLYMGTAMSFRQFITRRIPYLRPQSHGIYTFAADGGIYYEHQDVLEHRGENLIFFRKMDSLMRVCPDNVPVPLTKYSYKVNVYVKKLTTYWNDFVIRDSNLTVKDSAVNFVTTICQGIAPPVNGLPGKDNQISKISIYPNPVIDIMHINNLDSRKNYQLKILNKMGKLMKQSTINQASTFEISLAGLPADVYYLWLQNDESKTSLVLIKK
ncbi:MAG: T9SS type A sorting domain-containing protein [Bacteroidetes bacterium]|nr:T9SS type A sorting domain-containing protein [Bacteroidota bacterium]